MKKGRRKVATISSPAPCYNGGISEGTILYDVSNKLTTFLGETAMKASARNESAGVFIALAMGVFSTAGPWRLLAAADQPQQTDRAADDLGKKLIGTWKLEEAKTPGSPSGVGARLKLFTGTHWSIVPA